jgi:cystathionine beta-lyase/cystathionine gamma-synthase
MRLSAGVNERLVRLSIGIENSEDLVADLAQAMAG